VDFYYISRTPDTATLFLLPWFFFLAILALADLLPGIANNENYFQNVCKKVVDLFFF
jgi:hypothetical protein